MRERRAFVYAVQHILKGNAPSDFYTVRERLNDQPRNNRYPQRIRRAIVDATLEADYLISGSSVREYLAMDRAKRRNRLRVFVTCEKAALAWQEMKECIMSYLA